MRFGSWACLLRDGTAIKNSNDKQRPYWIYRWATSVTEQGRVMTNFTLGLIREIRTCGLVLVAFSPAFHAQFRALRLKIL
jgi:hypothetical protein